MSTKLVKKDSEFAEVLGIIRAGRANQPKLAALVRVLHWGAACVFRDRFQSAFRRGCVRIQPSLLRAKEACKVGARSGIFVINNTPQGYARKRTLKPGGYSFCAEGVL